MLGEMNRNIDISDFIDKLPIDYRELLNEAEYAEDNDADDIHYCNCAEDIDLGAKILYLNGVISKQQWDLLAMRYCIR